MGRYRTLVKLGLLAIVLIGGYLLLSPGHSVASAYPTALQSFDAPTAWQGQCQFPRHCTGQTCFVGTDPNEGCKFTGQTCQGCLF